MTLRSERHRVRGIDQIANRPAQKARDPATADWKRIGAEQRVEEGDEQREREPIERSGGDAAEYRARHAPPVGTQKGNEPSIYVLTRHVRTTGAG